MKQLKRMGLAFISALLVVVLLAAPVLAIALPDSTPTVESVDVYRNVLETGDMLILAFENTPYASEPPDYDYPEAFIWRLIDTDNTTELARATGYDYQSGGYGYNIISFYLNSANVTALGIAWEDALSLRLSGTPVAFTSSPPVYNYAISIGDYSSLTLTADVKAQIASWILVMAADLSNKWGLTASYYLYETTETGTALSIYGQAFFRGAIYGVQAMAPAAFPLGINDINDTDRGFTTGYVTSLETQNAANYIGDGMTAGSDFLDVDYNLFGILLVVGMCIVIIFTHWYLKGGNIWTGLVESVPALPIMARMGVIGLGEVGLIAAVCWLFISAKLWRII